MIRKRSTKILLLCILVIFACNIKTDRAAASSQPIAEWSNFLDYGECDIQTIHMKSSGMLEMIFEDDGEDKGTSGKFNIKVIQVLFCGLYDL